MKRAPLAARSFSARLAPGLVILILLTTLSAGVPAYWITRSQLERQAWSQVDNAHQATLSLLQAERSRLLNLAMLFAARPTLRRLVQEANWTELAPYLDAFRQQSELDILLYCDANGLLRAGQPILDACPRLDGDGFFALQKQPALLAAIPVEVDESGSADGMAVTGLWLDELFLRQLASDTGVEQSVLALDGERLATSIANGVNIASNRQPAQEALRQKITLGGRAFFAIESTLLDAAGAPLFFSEVALPVDVLIATENRALFILVASTGLVAVAGVVLAAWYIRRMTRPLAQLTRIAREIAQGNFVAPIPSFSGPLEVATLAVALQRSHAAMRQALDELAHARDWLNNLIQSIVEGVVILDGQGRIRFLSQGAETLTGWCSPEMVGKSVNDLFQPAEAGKDSFLDVVPAPGQRRRIDVLARHDQPLTLSVTSARLAPANGDKPQTALVLRDVTEEEAARHLRAYFLANITHEFRTPLSTLNASLQLMLDEQEALLASEMRELLKPTYLSLLSLQTLIDNLLESSRIEAGRFAIRRQPVDLRQIITDAVRIVTPLLERRRQTLELAVPDELPVLEVDAPHLVQVLVNLLTNAAKYSPIGEPVTLQIGQDQHGLRVTVADRGPGIPEAERMNLFRRFVRLEEQQGEHYGIGLGLHVVKSTIEAHGGQVGVDEGPGDGALFWFTLPVPLPGDEETEGRMQPKQV